MTSLSRLKSCEHEDDESCSYTKLCKEDPNKIAKRLSEYVDEREMNADEYDLEHADDYWTDDEGLAWDSHHHFRYKIVKIATDMRVEPEIKMVDIFIQKYFNWLKDHGRSSDDDLLMQCILDCGMHLHEKTIKILMENIKTIIRTGTIPPTENIKVIDQKIKKFILENPRQRSVTGTRDLQIGVFKDLYKREDYGYEYI